MNEILGVAELVAISSFGLLSGMAVMTAILRALESPSRTNLQPVLGTVLRSAADSPKHAPSLRGIPHRQSA